MSCARDDARCSNQDQNDLGGDKVHQERVEQLGHNVSKFMF
jgi:hypothetical protein